MSLGYALGAVLSFLVLRRRIGGVEGRAIVRTYSRLVLACVAAAVPALLVTRGLHHALGDSKPVGLLSLVAGGLVMLGVYLLACRRMRVAEVDELTGPLLRRFGR
jgi:putative peptidoglycan lipid II flippase